MIVKDILISINAGSIAGSVMTSDDPHFKSYLTSQRTADTLINRIIKLYDTVAIVYNIHVESGFRSQGIGTKLMRDFMGIVKEAGAKIILLVADTNEPNSMYLPEWYSLFGFDVIGVSGYDPIMVAEL